MISTIGSFVMAVGMLVFVVNVVKTFRDRPAAPTTTRGSPTRSSGTRPRRRRPGTSTASPTSRARGRCATCAAGWPRRGAAPDGPLGARDRRVAAVAGTGLAVVSGAAGWGTAHRLLAGVALPPLAALVAIAWVSARRELPVALAALVLLRARGAPDRPRRPPRSPPRPRSRRPRSRRLARSARVEPAAGVGARLRHPDEAADHVAPAADRRRRALRRAGGAPSAGASLLTMVGLALACGGASALNHYLDRDIDKLMGSRTEARPVASGPDSRGARARVRARALGVLVRAARLARQPADGAARARREPLLRPRLHALAQALDRPEHRHRRRRRRRAAARRLRGRVRPSRLGRARRCSRSSSSGRRRTSGRSR